MGEPVRVKRCSRTARFLSCRAFHTFRASHAFRPLQRNVTNVPPNSLPHTAASSANAAPPGAGHPTPGAHPTHFQHANIARYFTWFPPPNHPQNPPRPGRAPPASLRRPRANSLNSRTLRNGSSGIEIDSCLRVIDLSLVCGIALLVGQMASRHWTQTMVAGCAALLIASKHISRLGIGIAIILVAWGCYHAASSVLAYEQQRAADRDALTKPQICVGTVRVTSCPMQRDNRLSFVAEAIALQCQEQGTIKPGSRLRLYAETPDIARRDVLDVVARVATVEIARNFETDGGLAYAARAGPSLSGALLDSQRVYRSCLHPAAWIDRARIHARRRIDATYARDAAPMARALVLGENDLDHDDAEAFRLSGLSHLLAVSGTHIIIAVFSIVRLLGAMLRRVEALTARFDASRVAAAVGVVLAWVYAEFAGSGGSVRRAALMATVALSAKAMGRTPNAQRAFGMSLLCGALLDPLAAFDVSFGLSAAATAGLLVASRPLQAQLERIGKPISWCAPATAATVSSSAFCLPWLMLLGPKYSVVGVIANVVAVPIGELICLPACLCHLLLGPFPNLERALAMLGSGALLCVRYVAHFSASVEWMAMPTPQPTPWQLSIVAVFAVAILLRRQRRFVWVFAAVVAFFVAELAAIHVHQPLGLLRVTALDVGQGDSILIDFPNGQAMLIDGGGAVGSTVDPGTRVIIPALRERRRSTLSVAVVTHPHPDHFLGLISTLENHRPLQLWEASSHPGERPYTKYARFVRDNRRRRVTIVRPAQLCGKTALFGDAQLRVLGPCPDVSERDNDNNNSLVIHIRFGKRAALLMGDAEKEQEHDLLKLDHRLLRADLLKVGHHGSRTSTTRALLEAVQPGSAIISCGVRNRFGHPSPETLSALQHYGVDVFRSDRHGAIAWTTDGERVWIKTAASGL